MLTAQELRVAQDAMRVLQAARQARAEGKQGPKLASPEVYFKAPRPRRPGQPVRFK